MKKLFFTPFSIVFGIVGSVAGKRAFKAIWRRISDDPEPPSPKAPAESLGRIAASAALQGATLAASAAVARQLSVRAFHHLFGVWPVKPKQPKTADAS
ncbi:MAG TPA: DUF4235 domain-containing protein [Solirubrobacteraceae bacterium]|nr:DUF4235 domain-containing protein [Solirubrobacteraceae bacterium]